MKKSIVGFSAILLGLTACTTQNEMNQPLEVWNNFEPLSTSSLQVGENQSLVVFYRKDDIQGPAVNVYADGHYQVSLLPNAFSPVAFCAAKHLFSSSFTTNSGFGNRTDGVYYTLPVNQVAYVKVIQEASGKLNFLRVDAQTAEQEIAMLPKENQTLSRVPNPHNCGTPVLANESLDASALFKFNKSGYQDILPAGRQDIANFAQNIHSLGNVTGITVSGHTDPVGSARYNQVLSQKRAETVKQVLQQSGVTLPISAVGYGKSQPVVSHCASLKGKAQQECNQPNRRVEITIYGNQ